MSPTDSTPTTDNIMFEHIYSLNAFGKIPVHEYKSRKTGLTVVVAEVDGPIHSAIVYPVTEAFDDDGLPHTLEHLIFLGSEEYPHRGIIDMLANRCLGSGTNAWTDVDHTCYTMETAGPDGFLALMPVYLDHILYPTLTEESFVTEVHHINGAGEDAGVVYCEMQDRENNAENIMQTTMLRKMYPGKCGYSSVTGGVMKNLRESCSNQKVRNYHKEFYRPENLKLIITGKIKCDDIFLALSKIEEKIISKGNLGVFERPWQSAVPPFENQEDIVLKYPCDDECNGMFSVAWRGPCAVSDQYTFMALTLLMKYMTILSISPLQKEFVEIPDPYASNVSFNMLENAETCVYFCFHNVPCNKLPELMPKLTTILKRLADNNEIDMEQLRNIIEQHIQEYLSGIEMNPHDSIAFIIIGHMLYGRTREDLEQRTNPIIDFKKLLQEPKSFWISLLSKYFVDAKHLSVQGEPSNEKQISMAKEEQERVMQQINKLGEAGLREKEAILQKSIEVHERVTPDEVLQSIPIPSLNNISCHPIKRFHSKSTDKSMVDLSNTQVYTYFDHVKTNFVHLFVLLDTSGLSDEFRPYLPILLESIFESALNREGKIIPKEQVIAELNVDAINWNGMLGMGGGKASSFKCGEYSHTAVVLIQVEATKLTKGVKWLRELIFETIFDVEILKIIATKMLNNVSEAKRNGRDVASYAMKAITYKQGCNVQANGILRQQAFFVKLLDQLKSPDAESVIKTMNSVREMITHPSKIALYGAADLELVQNVPDALNDLLPERLQSLKDPQPLNAKNDYEFILSKLSPSASSIIGMGCLESSFFYHVTPAIKDYNHPDLPALLLYTQYLVQCEGPMWKSIRGKGFSYGYAIRLKLNEGLMYLAFTKATNVIGAYKETCDIIKKQLDEKKWDQSQFEAAKSSLFFETISEEKTIGSVINCSLLSYFREIDYTYNWKLLELIKNVTVDDLNRVGEKYMANLIDPARVNTVLVCDPSKAEEYKEGFKKMGLTLQVYTSLEESFLKAQ